MRLLRGESMPGTPTTVIRIEEVFLNDRLSENER